MLYCLKRTLDNQDYAKKTITQDICSWGRPWECDKCLTSEDWRTLSHKPATPINALLPAPVQFPCFLSSSERIHRFYFETSVPCERIVTSWPVTVIWGLLSIAVAGASLVTLVQPTWFVKKEKRNNHELETFMFGAFSFCYRVDYDEEFFCRFYDFVDLTHYPSGFWLGACLFHCSGCVVFTFCALASVLFNTLSSPTCRKQLVLTTGVVQAGGVLLLLVSLLLFPIGLGSAFVKHHCGEESAPFSAGSCQLGWGYALALTTTLVTVFCPILSLFTSYKIYNQSKIKIVV